jgi:plastocyanin
MRLLVLIALLLGISGHALAADLSVTVRDAHGMPVRDAVVMVYPAGPMPALRMAGPYKMAQHNIQFEPFVLIVPVGATVGFPNLDTVRHHVYSFSKPHPFELKLYGHDETRTVVFDKAGVIALGCNIHDQMIGYVRVVDTAFAAKTDGAGLAVIHGAAAGAASLKIWHPYLKAPGNENARPVTLHAGGDSFSETVDLRPAPDHMHSY